MNLPDMQQLAVATAAKFDIDNALFCALCRHESSWNTWAVRYEDGFYQRYISTMKLLTTTEMRMRAHSFGLGQIMGQTARELGFSGDYLTELCDPPKGLYFAAMKLQRCLKNKNGNFTDALLEYNGGANLAYPGLVMAHYDVYRNPQ